MNERPGVVVAVPAHDEESTIAECLHSLVRALRWARRRRVIAEATIQVVAHRCSDRTLDCARDALPDHLAQGVTADDRAVTIGGVRGGAVARGLGALARPPGSTWIFSTDADTIVPRRWVVDMLRSASSHDADVVVGLAELDRFRGSRPAQAAYDAILRGGLSPRRVTYARARSRVRRESCGSGGRVPASRRLPRRSARGGQAAGPGAGRQRRTRPAYTGRCRHDEWSADRSRA